MSKVTIISNDKHLGAFVCVQCNVSIAFDTIVEANEIADDHTLVCTKERK